MKSRSILKKILVLQYSTMFVIATIAFLLNLFALTKRSEGQIKTVLLELKESISVKKEELQSYDLLGLNDAILMTIKEIELQGNSSPLMVLSKEEIKQGEHVVLELSQNKVIATDLSNLEFSVWGYLTNELTVIIFATTLVFFIISAFTYRILKKDILNPIKEAIKLMHVAQFSGLDKVTAHGEIRFLLDNIKNYHRSALAKESEKQMFDMAKKVAHDIRSPAAVLDIAVAETSGIDPAQKRVLRESVLRIQDIANNLLENNRKFESNNINEAILVLPLINKIISEKRLQFRSNSNVNIHVLVKKNSYFAHAEINPNELKRVISNIVNNSVEAIGKDLGEVCICLEQTEKQVKVQVIDNGPGIHRSVVEAVNHKKPISYGKSNGNGLGLLSAKSFVEHMGGSFNLNLNSEGGTTVEMVFLRGRPPLGYVSSLKIAQDYCLVFLDDEKSIHEMWKEKFKNIKNKKIHIYSSSELRSFVKDYKGKFILFSDFDLNSECNESGLDLISELELENDSILVTSYYDDPEIRERSRNAGVSIVPKALALHLPIETQNDLKTVVHIDDDLLVRNIWKAGLEKKGIKYVSFDSPNELLGSLQSLSKDWSFYIDYDLSSEISGVELSEVLFSKGFKNLYLSTGFEASEFHNVSYLKGVVGKELPVH
ncbi:MAG: sensor histidine kinase [Bacteriovoracaceae bacterium]